LPKGTALNSDVSNTLMIASVVVNAVPSGKFVETTPGMVIEHGDDEPMRPCTG
jgi:hypothetical protein